MAKATIYMKFEGDNNKYPFGTYPFDTDTEKDFVNEVAMRVRVERDCETEVVPVSVRKVANYGR